MKLQDVILKATAKRLSWIEAAEIAGAAYSDCGNDIRSLATAVGSISGAANEACIGFPWKRRSGCWQPFG